LELADTARKCILYNYLSIMITINDKILIQHYLKGDERSFDVLVKRYLKLIYSFVYKNVGNQVEAEDITQEVFIKVWKNMKKFDQNKNFKPWIFQIAKNTSIDFLRKKKTIPFSRFENEKGQNSLAENIATKPLNLIENLSDKKVLLAAMQSLTDKDHKIIDLRHNYGMSFKEIAEVFKESINTIKSRYRRTLANLKKNIKRN
jgi:RNA polymerase sigma-70 factor (ECF subfamily)